VAWCHLRADYRTFRLDRINSLAITGEIFETSDTKSLQHFLARVEAERQACAETRIPNPHNE
jgi:predicted DNA-binding transcriptional regulator YafY